MVQRHIPIDTIHPHQNNGFVLASNGTTLIKRCAGQVERAATLEAGVYRLQLTFSCSLHGKDWTFKTTFTRETNRTLQADSARTPVNYSITEMPAVQQLQDLGEVGKVQVRLGALLARPAGLTRTQGGLNWLHFLWLCAIPPTAIATYFKRRQLFNRSDRKGASKNYVPGSESTKVSVPTRPHSYSIPMAVIKNVSIPSVIYLLRSVNSRYYNKLTVYVCPRFLRTINTFHILFYVRIKS